MQCFKEAPRNKFIAVGIIWLSFLPKRPCHSTWRSHPALEKLIFMIGHPYSPKMQDANREGRNCEKCLKIQKFNKK